MVGDDLGDQRQTQSLASRYAGKTVIEAGKTASVVVSLAKEGGE